MSGWYVAHAGRRAGSGAVWGPAADHQPAAHPNPSAGVGIEHLADLLEPGLLVGALCAMVHHLGGERDGRRPVLAFEKITDQRDDPRPYAAVDQIALADEQVDAERVLVRTH